LFKEEEKKEEEKRARGTGRGKKETKTSFFASLYLFFKIQRPSLVSVLFLEAIGI